MGLPETLKNEDCLYLALMKPNGEIWGPCLLSSLENKTATFAASDFSTLLVQGKDNPFEWLTAGENCQPTTWTLYTGRTYQRLMVVDSVQTQDALHYNLKLMNYDSRIYQYGNLPVPFWQGRTQVQTESVKPGTPQNFRGIIQAQTEILFVWEQVNGAEWYDFETSLDGFNWNNMGRVNIPQISITAEAGLFYARVRAASQEQAGSWSRIWSGDIAIPVPQPPDLKTDGAYLGGRARITWDATDYAVSYIVSLIPENSNTSVYTETISATEFQVTPEIQTGGPYRNLQVCIAAIGQNGTSLEKRILLSDPAPAAITRITVNIAENTAVIADATPLLPDDGTGYVLQKSTISDFDMPENMTEVKTFSRLPYTIENLAAGKHYFRMAMTDQLYDSGHDLTSLNWSEVYIVTIDGA